MLTISKPLSAGQAHQYHDREFSNARENYYTAADAIRGEWHGELAREWGLAGEVEREQFRRLADGQHPFTGETLVRHRAVCTYTNEHGQSVTTMGHRAGWDATFSAPKSVSLTALVGGDDRVREAHRQSVSAALEELERYVQARCGDHPAQTTGRWVAARFEHDSARPVDGYAAPQLHTHVVVFNVTRTDEGETRPLQPRELYRTQQYATAVYRSELATRLKRLGYDIERGVSDQPEIRGYTADYLEASSPRRQQIEAHLQEHGRSGAGAAQIAAHQTREPKREGAHEDMQLRHRELAQGFGQQPARVVQHALDRGQTLRDEPPRITAEAAVTFAGERNFEREAVVDERALLRDALRRSMGEVEVPAVKNAFEKSVAAGDFLDVSRSPAREDRAFRTREMQDLEREIVEMMRGGQGRHQALNDATPSAPAREPGHLSAEQAQAVHAIAGSRDQVLALEGVAGAGKTTTVWSIRTDATANGYQVKGLAPTSRAAQKLGESGIPSGTLQGHLTRTDLSEDRRPHIYVLDEAGLAGTRQMHEFLRRLNPGDRVLMVGDVRQHHAVEAGRPYQQLQAAGMFTARLDTIVRQQDPALRAVVEQLSRGEVQPALGALDRQGRLHEIPVRDDRIRAIAREYLKEPTGTLVVSPDNQSRVEINAAIHRAMQTVGRVPKHEYQVRVLVPRQDVTGADRQWAERYAVGDVVRYSKGSRVVGVDAGTYGRVKAVDGRENLVTVSLQGHGRRVTYDPRRLAGVTFYREEDRAFSKGDRVQLTAPDRGRGLANRELGTITTIERGQLDLRLDSGRTVSVDTKVRAHLDHGYAVTSHSSQGQTANRVLVHIDPNGPARHLVNQRLAYVAVSRGRFDAQIYTNNKTQLIESHGHDVSVRSIEPRPGSSINRGVASRTPPHISQGISRGIER